MIPMIPDEMNVDAATPPAKQRKLALLDTLVDALRELLDEEEAEDPLAVFLDETSESPEDGD